MPKILAQLEIPYIFKVPYIFSLSCVRAWFRLPLQHQEDTEHRTALEGATRPLMESDLLNGFGLLLALGLSPNWAPGAAWEKLIWYKLILWQWPWQGSGGGMDSCLLPYGERTRCSRRQAEQHGNTEVTDRPHVRLERWARVIWLQMLSWGF